MALSADKSKAGQKTDATVEVAKKTQATATPAKPPNKNKKKSLIIRAIVVACVIGLLADEFLNPSKEEENGAEGALAVAKKPVDSSSPSPVDNRNLPLPPEEKGKPSPPTPSVEEEPPPPQLPPAPELEPEPPPPAVADQLQLGEQEEANDKPPPPPPPSSAPREENRLSNSFRILNAIEIDPQQSYDPPGYLQEGRGLVYNCQKRHWACIDRASYFRCAQNQKSLQSAGKSPSCVVKDIYYSHTHCIRGQMQKIHQKAVAEECGDGS